MATTRTALENSLTLVTPGEAEAVAKDVLARLSKGAKATVNVGHEITARTKFSNNDVRTMESENTLGVSMKLTLNGQYAQGGTTRLDPAGLAEMVRSTEEAANAGQKDMLEFGGTLTPPQTFTDPPIYFDSSVNAGASGYQGDLIRGAAMQAQSAGLVAAGEIEVTADFLLVMNNAGFLGHTQSTYGEVTMTARTKDGKGSGWAWDGGEDFSKVDPKAIADKAIDLCRRSDKPVAVEPGRYTVILEPEAVAQLMNPIIDSNTRDMGVFAADQGQTVFSRKEGGNKLGLKMADDRVQILYDPMDRQLPFSPLSGDGSILSRTYWIEHGVLKNLAVWEYYGKKMKPPREQVANPGRAKLDIQGATQSLDEMIKSTKRGIWVHQFAAVGSTTLRTLLLTGVTRNGTFLIENGKITKAIKNLRFSESPFFILNKLDAFGPCVRASAGWAVPRLKVHDFEFTSLSDAV